MQANTALKTIAVLLVVWFIGYDAVRAYWLPIELKRTADKHYATWPRPPHETMVRTLQRKQKVWRSNGIEFEFIVYTDNDAVKLRGDSIVETRFLKYVGVPEITVSMDQVLYP